MFQRPVHDTATAIRLLGGLQNTPHVLGYNQVNMSLFKTFPAWREHYLQFRADVFNVLNHSALGAPANSLKNKADQITGRSSSKTTLPTRASSNYR